MASQAQQAGMILSGLSAGLQGRGLEFNEQMMQREALRKQQENERRKTVFTDSAAALKFAREGRFDLAAQLGQNRLEMSKNFPEADFKDTRQMTELAQLAASGDQEAGSRLLDQLSTNVQLGQSMGILPQPARQVVDGQVVELDPISGAGTASPIEGFARDPGKVEDRRLRERQLDLAESTEERQANKLSAGLEKALLDSQDRVVEAQRQSNKFTNLANEYERLGIEGGVGASFSETFKKLLGSQDDVTEFRREFNKVRLSEGLRNLPPGPATDRDVKEAFKGVPPENAPASQVASFLRGASRLARFEAGYNQFKSDFITQKRDAGGINKAWRKQVKAPKINREVSVAEIYETAQNRGVTPEEVMQNLGIEERIF